MQPVSKGFYLITEAGLSMKIEKCFFGVKTMDLLGYKCSPDGMAPFPDRDNAIRNFRVPVSSTGILCFTRMVRY